MKERLKKNKVVAYLHDLFIFGPVCWLEWKRKHSTGCNTSMFTFRMIRTSIITRQNEDDYISKEEYEIIGVWTGRAKSFHKYLKSGGHGKILPNYTLDGWTHFSYEIQSRMSQDIHAKWKSLGYIAPNCDIAK